MLKANQDIRDYMADHGVSQTKLAEAMGVSGYTVCTRLKKELSSQDKETWLNLIDSIEAQSLGETSNEESNEEVIEEQVEEVEEVETEEPEEDEGEPNKFQVGDQVKIPSKSGIIGTVSDVWHSLLQNKIMYAVTTDGSNMALYREDQLEPAPLPTEYSFSTTVENNVAVVCMIAHQGDKTWVCARGHAHILHDGEAGMAQAVSYAAKRMFESLDTKNEKRIYFKEGK